MKIPERKVHKHTHIHFNGMRSSFEISEDTSWPIYQKKIKTEGEKRKKKKSFFLRESSKIKIQNAVRCIHHGGAWWRIKLKSSSSKIKKEDQAPTPTPTHPATVS